jgi:hypothetical protein
MPSTITSKLLLLLVEKLGTAATKMSTMQKCIADHFVAALSARVKRRKAATRDDANFRRHPSRFSDTRAIELSPVSDMAAVKINIPKTELQIAAMPGNTVSRSI